MAESKLEKSHYMCGKMIEPLTLEGNESVADFINNVFGDSGFNARKLAEACRTYSTLLNDEANPTVALTLAGAMTPIGMNGPINTLIELGFVDFLVCTGANLYHDLHRAYNYPVRQGEIRVDDEELYKLGISRIYDTYINDDETLLATDKCILNTIERMIPEVPISTAVLHNELGKTVLKTAKNPEKSLLATAAKFNVPIYTSSPGDSSIGMNMVLPRLFGFEIDIDPILDIIETTALVREANKNGVIIVGGGSPKNFYLQTQPTLWQVLWDNEKGGHDYFIQLTTDSPQWGGLSGATPQEAKSWGKVKDAVKNNVVVYSCASLTFPLLAQYVKMTNKPRERKELYLKRDEYVDRLKKMVFKNNVLIKEIKKSTTKDRYEKIYKKHLGEQEPQQ
ncbi:MAG: deoxyhypusine synthase [Candidatus Micrarchaeota archaeon]